MTLGYINHLVWTREPQKFDGSNAMKTSFCLVVGVLWFIFWPLVALTGAGIIFNEDEE